MNTGVSLSIKPLVELKDWGFRSSSRKKWALRHIDFELKAGERVLVLGASGAGKSTLFKAIAGVLEEGEQEGSLLIDSKAAHEALGTVGLLLQDPDSQVILQRVADDVAFACENLAIEPAEIKRRVQESLEAVGLRLDFDHNTEELSGGQKQRMALAGLLAMQPKLLLLDEPSANLDPKGKLEVVQAVSALLSQEENLSLMIIEHDYEPWLDMIDRVILIDDQDIVASASPQEMFSRYASVLQKAGVWLPGERDEIVASALKSASQQKVGQVRQQNLLPKKNKQEHKTLLSCKDLSIGYEVDKPIKSGINLEIQEGDSLCIVGSNGAGKSTLALSLAGALKSLKGQVSWHELGSNNPEGDKPGSAASLTSKDSGASLSSPYEWQSKDYLGKMAYVFQEPEYQFLASTAIDELLLSLSRSNLTDEQKKEKAHEMLASMGLDKLALAHPMTLSGGEKRRLSVACALIHAPSLIILDEPSFGQDRNTWWALLDRLKTLQEQGISIISISHDKAYNALMGNKSINLDDYHDEHQGDTSCREGTKLGGDKGALQQGRQESARKSPKSAKTFRSHKRWDHVSQINPVFQLLGLLIMTSPLLSTIDPVSAVCALALELVLIPFCGLSLRSFLRRISPLFIAAPLVACSMLLYADPKGHIFTSFGPMTISENSIYLAISIALRVFALALPALVLLSKIDVHIMAQGLIQILKLPVKPVLASLSGLRMLSLMLSDYEALKRAHRLRGVEAKNPLKRLFKRAFSLLLFALRRSEKLSCAMEARGFASSKQRTWMRTLEILPASYIFLFISVLIPLIAITLAIITGEFRPMGRGGLA